MQRLAITATLCLLVAGCSVDELVLNEAEQRDLVENFEAAVAVYSDLTEFAFTTAFGNGDLEGYTYDPPTEANGWIGTIIWNNALFESGSGDLTMHFSVVGDTGPVDPYSVDLSDDDSVSADIDIQFTGTSSEGAPLAADADFTIDLVLQDGETASTILNGDFLVQHNAYVADLLARDFSLLFDLETQEAFSASGDIVGSIDIPNFAFDGAFSLEGLGPDLSALINVAGTRVNYLMRLVDF